MRMKGKRWMIVLAVTLCVAGTMAWWWREGDPRPTVRLVSIEESAPGLRRVSFVLENHTRATFVPDGSTRFAGLLYKFPTASGWKVRENFGVGFWPPDGVGDDKLQPGERLELRMHIPTAEPDAVGAQFQFGIRVQREPSTAHRKITGFLSRWLPIRPARRTEVEVWSEVVTP